MLYENGLQGLSVDFSKALAWYRKSVDLGCAPGLYDLAGMYDQGKGCTMDKKKALQLYERAYDMMDEVSGYAACRIGEIYKAGIGIRPDMKVIWKRPSLLWENVMSMEKARNWIRNRR